MTASAVHHFNDPVPYQQAIHAAEIEVLPTAKGRFKADLTQVKFDRLWMQRGRESLPRVFRSTVSKMRAPIVFLTEPNQAPIHHSGVEVKANDIVFDGAAASHHHRSWGACAWAAMSLTPSELRNASQILVGHEISVPESTHLIRPAPQQMSRLLALHEAVGTLAETAPNILQHEEVSRSLEQALINAMLECLLDGSKTQLDNKRRNHLRIVRRLEEFLGENWARPVYLSELCAATDACQRTLRISCEEHLGMGPVRYLWLRRMYLVRRALQVAESNAATVTEIAMSHGFWELGRFSTEYKSLFGERPSATLRRPAGEPIAFQKWHAAHRGI